jgi:hypothetical protein
VHGIEVRAVLLEATVQAATGGVAGIDRVSELERHLCGVVSGLGTLALPAGVVLRPSGWCDVIATPAMERRLRY